jgi:hypothetical protein
MEARRLYQNHNPRTERHDSAAVKWADLKNEIGDHWDFAHERWLIQYHDSSITFKHTKRKHQLRLSINGELTVNQAVNPKELVFRSKHHQSKTAKDAVIMTREFLSTLN